MNINTDTLKLFVAAAENRSFTKAGDLFLLTQPAVSKRIAQLEENLGTQLFDRIGRQIVLTEAGGTLLPRAREMINRLNDMTRAIGNLSGKVEGVLAIGTSHHVGLHRLPPYLKSYSRKFPLVKLNIKFMESEEIYEQVIQGRLELGIVTLPENPNSLLQTKSLWEDKLSFMVGGDHPLNACQTISLDELLDYPAILPESKTFTRKIVENIVSERSKKLRCELSTNNLETIRMLTKIGLGWSVLPNTMSEAGLSKLNILNVKISRQLGIVLHGQRTLSNAAKEILSLLEAEASN
ncbi:MAG: LysR family transcriptional regulator [Pseudomonadales bacterium]|nr:LysR family transcriptional regulator [Pseudomonadales bacterium]